MNRYPWWKYLILGIALLVGLIYTLPNFYGEAPAVQVASGKATTLVGETTRGRAKRACALSGARRRSAESSLVRRWMRTRS